MQQPCSLYEHLFALLYARCQRSTKGHGFRFNNKLYSLDASLIDLSLKIFPWAHYSLGKAAMKLHVGLDHEGCLPAFAAITTGKTSNIEMGRTIQFPKGSIVVTDKGYTDYRWYKQLNNKGIFFVTRARKNMLFKVIERHDVDRSTGLRCDQRISLTGIKPKKIGIPIFRRIDYRDL